MFCSKCGKEMNNNGSFCSNCENSKIDTLKTSKNTSNKNIPWHQNFKWWQILLISIISLIIYSITKIYLFDYIFIIGIIFALVQFIKQLKSKKKS